MSEPAWTAGRWILYHAGDVVEVLPAMRDGAICRVNTGIPDAMLISAAPDLYKALSRVMEWISGWSPNFTDDADWSDDHDFVKAALAKARGEQP